MIRNSIALVILLALTACTKSQAPAQQQGAAAAPGAAKVLHLYCWSNYFSPEFIDAFEKKTGSKVDMNYFSSNEELLAKLQAGARGYDLIVPTGYLIQPLQKMGLIEQLGKLDWPELANLYGRAKAPKADPNHEYAVPYQWGTTGIAVNTKKLKTKVDSWAWVFNHPELKGQVGMLDDAPAVIGAALKYLGYPYNESSDAALAKAKDVLMKQKKWLKTYTADAIPVLDAGEAAIMQAYSGDTLQVHGRHANIEYVMPKEGGELYIDFLAIPKGAPSPDLAKEFIRFSLDKKMAVAQTAHLFYNPVVDIRDVPGAESLYKNPVIFPDEKILEKFEVLDDNPERTEKLQRLWTELKSS